MKRIIKLLSLFSLLLTIVYLSACQKTNYESSALALTFHVDTFMFDTVFAEQGSSTRVLKVFNDSKKAIKIDEVYFAKGEQSPYTLNIEGQNGKRAEHINLLPNDSIYVFLRASIDPTDENNPFIVGDDLVFKSQDGQKTLPVLAYAQNAIYIKDSVLSTQTWTNEKPYIIMHNALVAEGETLTIKEGVQVYMHADSRLFVTGTLKIQGTLEEPVRFQGDRIDRKILVGSHTDLPGEWGGLYFSSTSHNNEIDYAIIKNGGNSTFLGESRVMAASIQVDKDELNNGIPKLKMTNTIIRHSLGHGLLAFNSSVYMDNCVVVQTGGANVVFNEGGDYELYNSTIATYSEQFLQSSRTPSLIMMNYFMITDQEYVAAPLKVKMENVIASGADETELFVDRVEEYPADISIKNSLFNTEEVLPDYVEQKNLIINQDAKFADESEYDFSVKSSSPAKGAGSQVGMPYDILGEARVSPYTIGAYQ